MARAPAKPKPAPTTPPSEAPGEVLYVSPAPLMPIPDGLSLTTDLWNRCVSHFGVEEATRLARAFAPAAVEEILP